MNFGEKHIADLRRMLFVSFLLLLFIFCLQGQALAKAYFLRHPYPVYQNDPTTMTILTHTNYFVDKAKIFWNTEHGQSGSASMKVQKSNEHPNRHDYKVVSYTWPHGTFKPNTRVYYRVKVTCSWCGDAEYVGDFYTAYRHDHKTLAFFAYSDTHADSAQDYKPFEKVMDRMWDVSTHNVERLILHAGDFIFEGGNTPYFPKNNKFNKYFYRQSKSHKDANYCYRRMPIMAAVGNHDYQGPDKGGLPHNMKYHIQGLPYQMYKRSSGMNPMNHLNDSLMGDDYLEKSYYSFDYGPVHFISLSSSNDNIHHTKPAGKKPSPKRFSGRNRQYTWLERDLKKNTKPWTVVFLHAPIWNGQLTHRDNHKWLIPLFERYGVTVVFYGHDHWFWYGKRSGINGKGDGPKISYMNLGGGGAWNVWDQTNHKKYGVYMKHRFNFARVVVRHASGKGANAYHMVAIVNFDKVSGSGKKRKKKAKKKKNWKWWVKTFILSEAKYY